MRSPQLPGGMFFCRCLCGLQDVAVMGVGGRDWWQVWGSGEF